MTVTNNGLICQRYCKEEEDLNECVGVQHAYMYITDSVGLVTVPQAHTVVARTLRGIFSTAAPTPKYNNPKKCTRRNTQAAFCSSYMLKQGL